MPQAKRKSSTKSRPRRQQDKSVYELYPLPFMDIKTRCMWTPKPTGDYRADCFTGGRLARKFLATADGTHRWNAMLGWIIADMIRMGPQKAYPDGGVSAGGIVVGFMSHIARALNFAMTCDVGMDFMLAYADYEDAKKLIAIIDNRARHARGKDAKDVEVDLTLASEKKRLAEYALAACKATGPSAVRVRAQVLAEMIGDVFELGVPTDELQEPRGNGRLSKMARALLADLEGVK